MGSSLDYLIDAVPKALNLVRRRAFDDGLIGPIGINLVGSPGIEPGDRTAKAHPFGGDDANVVGSEGLTKETGIEFLNGLICQAPHPLVPSPILLPGQFDLFFDYRPIGDQGHLHPVDDGGEIGLELGDEDLAEVLHAHSLGRRLFADPHPVQVPLGHVPQSFPVVDVVVDPPLQHPFELLLHLPAVNIHHDA